MNVNGCPSSEEAKLLDGKVASGEIRAQLKAEIAEIQKENPAFVPGLAIVQVRYDNDKTSVEWKRQRSTRIALSRLPGRSSTSSTPCSVSVARFLARALTRSLGCSHSLTWLLSP